MKVELLCIAAMTGFVGFCYELVSVVFVVVLPHELHLFIVERVCVSKLE